MGQLLRSVPVKNPHSHFTRYIRRKIHSDHPHFTHFTSADPPVRRSAFYRKPKSRPTDILSCTVSELSQHIVQM